MKMLIEKKILLEGLNAVSKALSTRNIIPVLNGIKFDLNSKGLYLTATDNDITIEYFIDKKNNRLTGVRGKTAAWRCTRSRLCKHSFLKGACQRRHTEIYCY